MRQRIWYTATMALNPAHSLHSASMRASRKPRIILVILIGLCGVFVYSYTSRLAEKSQLDAEIMAVQARIAEAKVEQHKLEAELEYLKEPDYIDQVARETFDRAKPGDKVLVIVDQAATGQVATEAVSAVTAMNPSICAVR